MAKQYPRNHRLINLSNITTYQSGVIQSAAIRKLNRVLADLLKVHNLTTMEWFIIGTVHDAGENGMNLTDLKNKLGTTMPFITNSVKTLLVKEVLVKSLGTHDARIKIVAITPSYRHVCLEIEAYLRVKMRELFYENITPEELRTYVDVLYRLSDL
jgi:DNA-binding MarR family transcriptional regulator